MGLKEALVDIGDYLIYWRGLYNKNHVSMVDGCLDWMYGGLSMCVLYRLLVLHLYICV